MNKREFIKENKQELDSSIFGLYKLNTINNDDRELFIENDEKPIGYGF